MLDDGQTPKQRYVARLQALKKERESWTAHWRDLSEQIQPRRSRFLTSERNRGDKKHSHIINGTPTWSARILSSGMMAGITSPARPWFRLATPDPALNEFGAVKQWLSVVEDRLRLAFQRSNSYQSLHTVYGDLGTPGVAVMFVEEDAEDVLRSYVFPIGSYCLANSARQAVDTVYRETSMTVGQVVSMFATKPDGSHDWSNVSDRVKTDFEQRRVDAWVDVCHVIQPNTSQQRDVIGYRGMPTSSCWFEVEVAGDGPEKLLREGGYEEFPAMCPRWATTGEDVYGSSPGMEALGDCRALQLLEKRAMEVLDKIVRPPMVGPTALMGQRSSLLPGETTYLDELRPGSGFRPAISVDSSALPHAEAKIREHEGRIKQAFFADLWLMLANSGQTMTAREVAERHEEKMLQLGPVLERLQDELLDPLVSRTFGILLRNGLLPPPPEELQGQDLRVEYISILAQAQKLLGTTAVERLASFVGNLAAANEATLDKLDMDQMVDAYAEMLGTPPALVRSDEDVKAIRNERAQAQQQQAQMEQAQLAAQGAKVLSETDTGSDNALTRLLGNLGGQAPAAGTVQ